MRFAFDIETNGLLDECTTVHCIVLKDLDTGRVWPFGTGLREEYDPSNGVEMLRTADEIIGHNIIQFDIPAIQKVYPWFKPRGKITDTLVLSRLIYPDIKDRDFRLIKRDDTYPKNLIGSHGLKAWGYRMGEHKGEYDGGWETWSPEMQSYCEQDVEVTVHLYEKLMSKEPSSESVELEHAVAQIIWRQENYGFGFDVTAAGELYTALVARRLDLERELRSVFPPWIVRTPFTPKRDNKTKGYVKGVTIYKEQECEFNPNSRDHIAEKLKEKYSWSPKDFTPEGKPKVDEEVLSKLEYPEAKLLAEHFMLVKRLGQLGEGRQSWIKAERNGRLHGRVNTNGAVTGRMTHLHPNMAQVPSTRAPYGEECRRLFIAGVGKRLVGCDADALELRCLAGYMAHYDGGAYIDTVLRGDKVAGTDMHSQNARVLGCDRDTAKTWFYAFIYGAGVAKLGRILGRGPKAGVQSRKAFLRSLPALARLIGGVQRAASKRGYLLGLDGRKLSIRSEHAALNTLLQSAGAVLMKKALVILDADLQSYQGRYEFVANVHDEWQIECDEDIADEVGKLAVRSIVKAGEYYGFKCPLDANYSVGKTWADTH